MHVSKHSKVMFLGVKFWDLNTATAMGIHRDDDDSPTSARIMSSSSKYQAHRRAVEAQPQKSRPSTAALLYMSMHLLSQMDLRSINRLRTCCHGDEHTSKV